MEGLEFYISGADVYVEDGSGCHRLDEGSPLVGRIMEYVDSMYPLAAAALRECYSKSARNAHYYNYLMARRFCKCNFGSLDHTMSDLGAVVGLEDVSCPLRGECRYEGVICHPKVQTTLTEAELRVMRLVRDGLSNVQIADELYLSPNTVKRHIHSSFVKTGSGNRSEFIKKASEYGIL